MADLDDADESAPEQRRGGILHAVALACAIALAIGGIGSGRVAAGVGPGSRRKATAVPPAVAGTREGTLEPMDPFIANLADEDGRRYLKATLQVEFYDAVAPPEFHRRLRRRATCC
jgi:flagellar basal body-associated protein FliL